MRVRATRWLAMLLVLLSTAATAGPRLYVFDCGQIFLDSVTDFGLKDEETPVRELFVPCYVVEHEKGRLLWDAGLPLGVAKADGGRVKEEGYELA